MASQILFCDEFLQVRLAEARDDFACGSLGVIEKIAERAIGALLAALCEIRGNRIVRVGDLIAKLAVFEEGGAFNERIY